jgi:DNA-binding NarL/FixJ family response regulator
MPFRVLLADDADIMRRAVVSMLYEEPSIEVVGEAANFGQVVQLIADLKPEVLVMDLHLAKMFPAVLVRAQLSTVGRVVAVSFANDSEARM